MNELFIILQKLSEYKVAFCLQSQGKHNYYNLSIETPLGKREHIDSDNLKEIENKLKLMWGHLIVSKPAISMPLPR